MTAKLAPLLTPTGLADTSLLGPDGTYHVVASPAANVSMSGDTPRSGPAGRTRARERGDA